MKIKVSFSNKSFGSVAVLNAASSIIKIITSFVTTKIVASLIGPSGIALIGQLSNFLSLTFAFSTGGITGGVVKYTAECNGNSKLLKFYISTSFFITLFFSLCIGGILLLTGSYLSNKIFFSSDYYIVFLIGGISLVGYGINSLLLSIINGLNEFKKYTYINILSSILSLIITIVLVFFFKIKGALAGLVLSQVLVVFITIKFVKSDKWFKRDILINHFSKKIAYRFFKYSVMAVVTAVLVPSTQFFIRSYVIDNFSMEQAGIWEGMNKVSNMYLTVVTTTLSIYFLPRFSALKNDTELSVEIWKAYKIIVPLLVLACTIIYMLRNIIIQIVFSLDFLSMENLFSFQLAGDIVKMMTWVFGTVMVSKAMYKRYIFFEMTTNLLLYFLAIWFSKIFGLIGLCLGYLIALLITLIIMVLMFRKLLFIRKNVEVYERD